MMNKLYLMLWIGWLIYSILGKEKYILRIIAIFGSVMGILVYLEKILG